MSETITVLVPCRDGGLPTLRQERLNRGLHLLGGAVRDAVRDSKDRLDRLTRVEVFDVVHADDAVLVLPRDQPLTLEDGVERDVPGLVVDVRRHVPGDVGTRHDGRARVRGERQQAPAGSGCRPT